MSKTCTLGDMLGILREFFEKYYEQNGSLPDNDDDTLKELHVTIRGEVYDEGYDYELHGHGAKIRRGDDHVYLYPRP